MLFLTFSVLVTTPQKLLYTVTNPTPRGLLNRENNTKRDRLTAKCKLMDSRHA